MKNLKDLKFNITVSDYSNWNERSSEVIVDMIAGAPVLGQIVPMTGVKANTTAEMNILNTNVTWSTADCVSTETGDNTTIKPRKVSVVRLSDRELLCLDKLDAKLPMLLTPGAAEQDITFDQAFMDLKIKKNALALEKLAFQGSITGGTGNLAVADGWVQIAKNETGALGYYAASTAFTASNIIDQVNQIVANRTDAQFEADDLKLFMSYQAAAIYAQALVEANLYHYTGKENESGVMRFYVPGTNIEVFGTAGLSGTKVLMLTSLSNLRYATDLESDKESVELFYDKYHKQLVSDIVFSIGFQYEFPSQVLLMA